MVSSFLKAFAAECYLMVQIGYLNAEFKLLFSQMALVSKVCLKIVCPAKSAVEEKSSLKEKILGCQSPWLTNGGKSSALAESFIWINLLYIGWNLTLTFSSPPTL